MANTSTEMAKILSMAKGLQQSANQATNAITSFMKFTRFGEWLYGTDDVEAAPDSLWVVHPQSFEHGWIAWGNKENNNHGEKLGEIKVLATEPLPLESSLDHVEGSWNQQAAMQMLCLTGMDKDTRVTFNTSSTGGRRLYQKIVQSVIEQITEGKAAVAPVVKLDKDSYIHTKFGKIFTPLMTIMEWKTLAELNALMDNLGVGDSGGETEPETEAETKAPSRKKRTRKA